MVTLTALVLVVEITGEATALNPAAETLKLIGFWLELRPDPPPPPPVALYTTSMCCVFALPTRSKPALHGPRAAPQVVFVLVTVTVAGVVRPGDELTENHDAVLFCIWKVTGVDPLLATSIVKEV
jgi:hypothetical protein